jgi:hypothetical protein
MATKTAVPPPATIGGDLERLRLEHRAERIEFTIKALRRLADSRAPGRSAPAPLRQALDGFSDELATVRHRLTEL